MESKTNYIERYWRDARPQDAIKEPPMVARFLRRKSNWFIAKLHGCWRDLDDNLKWGEGSGLCYTTCQVYDAPKPKYVPFTWEDREQLRGRWIVDGAGDEQCIIRLDQYQEVLIINDNPADKALEEWNFADTGEPVGKKVQ